MRNNYFAILFLVTILKTNAQTFPPFLNPSFETALSNWTITSTNSQEGFSSATSITSGAPCGANALGIHIDDFGGAKLTQQFSTPLIAGNNYSFIFDYSHPLVDGHGANIPFNFFLGAAPNQLKQQIHTLTMPPAGTPGWFCELVSFVPDSAYQYFTINALASGRFLAYIDCIRPLGYGLNMPTSVCFGDTANLQIQGNISTISSVTWSITGANTTTSVSAYHQKVLWSAPGIYSVSATVNDVSACAAPVTITKTISVVGSPIITVAPNNANLCIGQQTITLNASGANTYTWVTQSGLISAGSSSITVSPASTTNYSVVGVNSTGCINYTTVTINAVAIPTLTINSSTICIGQQTATLSVLGATNYSWSAGTSSSNGSLVTANPLTTTIYTVLGTDANNCFATITTTIFVNSLPTLTVSPSSSTICIGQQNVTLNVTGASTYTWNTLQTSNNIVQSPSVTTTYSVVGLSNVGCYNYTTATVFVNSTPTISINNASVCLGQQIPTLQATGATSYTWNTNQTTSFISPTPTSTSTYTVFGIDANNCFDTETATITVNSLPTVSIPSTSFVCIGSGTFQLVAQGATNYSWTSSGFSTQTGSTINVAEPNASVSYTLTGSDNNGCYSQAFGTTNVVLLPNLTVLSVTGNTICPLSTASLTVQGAINYTWFPTPSLSSPSGSLAVYNPLANAIYTVVATNGICNNTATVAVFISFTPTVTASSGSICSGNSIVLNSSGAVSYTWSPPSDFGNPFGSTVTVNPSATSIYTVFGSSSLGCIGSLTTTVLVTDTPTITSTFSTTTILEGTEITLNVQSTTNNYSWTPTSDLSCSTCSNPIANPTDTQVYCVVSDNASCTNTLCITINVEKKCATNETLGLPNAFSPNGDGINDEYCLQGWNKCVTSFSIKIFDRWGEKIFESNDPNFCWDGTYKGKVLNPSVYVYFAKATFNNTSPYSKQGNITLIK